MERNVRQSIDGKDRVGVMTTWLTNEALEQSKVGWRKMSNRDLLDEVIALSQPDDYDGVQTADGYMLYCAACDILIERLTETGWL